MIEPISLPGGTTLLVERTAAANAAAVGFWFPVGSRTERGTERGYTHFCEHMAFKGTEARTAFEIARGIDNVGGYLNAFTERDVVCFHCTVPASSWRFAVEILADICFNATFPKEEFDRERSVVVNEIISASDDPEECANDAFVEGIWKDDPISSKIAGEVHDVERFERDSVYTYFKERFTSRDLIVSVAGPVNPVDVREELLKRIPPSRAGDDRPIPRTPVRTPLKKAIKARIGQIYLFSGGPIDPPFESSDFYSLTVLNNAYGESMSSRLFQELRERRGLCYTVYSTFAMTPSIGLWMVYAATTARDFPELIEALSEQRAKLLQDGLTEREIGDSIRHLSGSFIMSLDDVESRMKRIARQYLFSGYALDPEETLGMISSVNPSSVARMAERAFAYDDVLAYGKIGGRERNRLAARNPLWK